MTRAGAMTTGHGSVTCEATTDRGTMVHMSFRMPHPDIWEWTIVPSGAAPPPPTGMVVTPAEPPDTITGTTTPDGWALGAERSILRVDTDPWLFRMEDQDGRILFRENPSDVDGLGRPFVLPLGIVQGSHGPEAVTFACHLEPDEVLFGLGEKFLPLNRHGQRITAWTQDAFGSTSERSHKNIPLLISARGYGLFLDSGARIVWDLGVASCQSCTVTVEAPSLRMYLIPGRDPAEILRRYATLTGNAPVPPPWTFGLWVSSGGTYRDQPAMEALIDGLDRHAIPADVVHIDPWWMKWRTYCDFRWDTASFPDLPGLMARMRQKGLRLCLWEHPYISVESDLFATGVERGYFLRRPDGDVYVIDYGLSLAPRPDGVVREATPETSWNARVAIIDMTNPEAVRWFQDLHRPVFAAGADIFKTDFGEDIPADAVFSNGATGRTMHNLYPLLYNEAVAAVTRQERGYGVVWGRAAIGGSQRTPVCWSGDPAADFDSLACTVRGGLSMGLSGVPFWSNDIGGYRGMPSPDLYVRWAQFGLFCSHSRMHGDSPREPWIFGEEALTIVRQYVHLRYRLFPYLYSAAIDASRTGMPVMRALPLVWPDDPHAHVYDQQYMLGPSLMVAPVVHPTGRKTVYLPEGKWIDFWSGEVIRGPEVLILQVPLSVLPLYVRAGAVIPMLEQDARITGGRHERLVLSLWSDDPGTTCFSDDDGETEIHVSPGFEHCTVSWQGPVERTYHLEVHDSGYRGVVLEGDTGRARKGSMLIRL